MLAAVLLILLSRRVEVPLPMAFDGRQSIGCVTGQNADDHFWYTVVYVQFPEPGPETDRNGMWKHYNYSIDETKEKGERHCNEWLNAVHKLLRERATQK